MTEPEAIKLVAELMAAYRAGATVPQATFDVYVADLIDLDPQAAAAAVRQLRQTRTFLPSIAEVRAAAAELTSGRVPDGDEAWAQVQAQIRTAHYDGTPHFTHPAIAAAVAAMGWRELCGSTNQIADRAHFFTLYAAGRTRIERDRAIAPDVAELVAAVAGRYQLPGPARQLQGRRP